MRWFCNYCKEEHDSRDPNLFPPETFPALSEASGEYIAGTEKPIQVVRRTMRRDGFSMQQIEDFENYLSRHNEADRDSGELEDVNDEEVERWYENWESEGMPHTAATKPPHLRESEGQKACWNCWAYDNGHCEMFGGYKVREDQVCDDWEKTKKSKTSANNLLYDREQHPEGKGFILDDGSVWTWPTENLKPMHMQYDMKAKNQGFQPVPGSAFHIKEGKVWQYGPGRSLSPEQQQTIFAADPKLELAPSKRQEELDAKPGFGHGQNVLDILERESSWIFQSVVNIPEIAHRIYERGIEGVGATINLHGEEPHTRYGYSPDPATDTPIPPQQFTPKVVEDFIAKWAARLRDPDKYVGSWVRDDGMIVLDVSEGHDDFHEAMTRAFAGQQEAIWGNEKNEAIPVVDPASLTPPPPVL